MLRCGIEIRAQPRARPCGPSAFSLEESGPWWPSPCTLPFEDSPHPPSAWWTRLRRLWTRPTAPGLSATCGRWPQRPSFCSLPTAGETMEAADVLYGVTMERQGVSRVLKLDLHQAEALLDGAPA